MGANEDLRQLRSVFRQAVKACRLTGRQIEKALGIGHGNLTKLLDGDLELRVRHVLAFAYLLDVPPHDFLALGCPPPATGAKYRLQDWIGSLEFKPPHAAKANALSEDPTAQLKQAIRDELGADLKDAVRAVLREEGITAPAKRDKSP